MSTVSSFADVRAALTDPDTTLSDIVEAYLNNHYTQAEYEATLTGVYARFTDADDPDTDPYLVVEFEYFDDEEFAGIARTGTAEVFTRDTDDRLRYETVTVTACDDLYASLHDRFAAHDADTETVRQLITLTATSN